MPEAVMEKMTEQIAEKAHNFSRAATALSEVIDDGIGVVKRAAKKSGDVLEELMDDNTLRIKRHPLETVMTSVAVGFVAGMLVGWLMRRK